jgi:hypothetical protein
VVAKSLVVASGTMACHGRIDPPSPDVSEAGLWTREMVREVIRREFGVRLSVVSAGRLLRKLCPLSY